MLLLPTLVQRRQPDEAEGAQAVGEVTNTKRVDRRADGGEEVATVAVVTGVEVVEVEVVVGPALIPVTTLMRNGLHCHESSVTIYLKHEGQSELSTRLRQLMT
jgi:hypothetical protein